MDDAAPFPAPDTADYMTREQAVAFSEKFGGDTAAVNQYFDVVEKAHKEGQNISALSARVVPNGTVLPAWADKYIGDNWRHAQMRDLATRGKTEDEAREIVLNQLWHKMSSTALPHQSTAAYRAFDEYCDFLHYGN